MSGMKPAAESAPTSNGRWFTLYERYLETGVLRTLTQGQQHVLLALLKFADSRSLQARPSIATLGRLAGLQKRSVQRAVKVLVDRKLVQRTAGCGVGHPSRYRLAMPDPPAKAAADPPQGRPAKGDRRRSPFQDGAKGDISGPKGDRRMSPSLPLELPNNSSRATGAEKQPRQSAPDAPVAAALLGLGFQNGAVARLVPLVVETAADKGQTVDALIVEAVAGADHRKPANRLGYLRCHLTDQTYGLPPALAAEQRSAAARAERDRAIEACRRARQAENDAYDAEQAGRDAIFEGIAPDMLRELEADARELPGKLHQMLCKLPEDATVETSRALRSAVWALLIERGLADPPTIKFPARATA